MSEEKVDTEVTKVQVLEPETNEIPAGASRLPETETETDKEQEPEIDEDAKEREETVEESLDTGLSGDRDRAISAEAVHLEEKAYADGDGEPASMPSFFIGDLDKGERERVRVSIDILSSRKTGKIMSVSRTGIGIDFSKLKALVHTEAWFDFTVPTYDDIASYRKQCGVWYQQAQQVLIDKLHMRDFMLVWHLKDWSIQNAQGKKIELEHDEDGSLNKRSMKKVYALHPTIVDVVLTVFERDALLTS